MMKLVIVALLCAVATAQITDCAIDLDDCVFLSSFEIEIPAEQEASIVPLILVKKGAKGDGYTTPDPDIVDLMLDAVGDALTAAGEDVELRIIDVDVDGDFITPTPSPMQTPAKNNADDKQMGMDDDTEPTGMGMDGMDDDTEPTGMGMDGMDDDTESSGMGMDGMDDDTESTGMGMDMDDTDTESTGMGMDDMDDMDEPSDMGMMGMGDDPDTVTVTITFALITNCANGVPQLDEAIMVQSLTDDGITVLDSDLDVANNPDLCREAAGTVIAGCLDNEDTDETEEEELCIASQTTLLCCNDNLKKANPLVTNKQTACSVTLTSRTAIENFLFNTCSDFVPSVVTNAPASNASDGTSNSTSVSLAVAGGGLIAVAALGVVLLRKGGSSQSAARQRVHKQRVPGPYVGPGNTVIAPRPTPTTVQPSHAPVSHSGYAQDVEDDGFSDDEEVQEVYL